jgi:DNA-binding transcriptional LysR family regulator
MVNLSRIDLNLFVVLEAIVVEGGVSRAAEKLNLTQPAVSHALARLREMLGDPLFTRHGRKLVPTGFTKRLIEPLSQSLRSFDLLLDKGRGFAPSRSQQTFVVAMRDPAEVVILPTIMHSIARDAPGIDLQVIQVRRRSLEAALADGTVDVALDVPLPLSDSVRRQRLAADGFVVVARRGHPEMRPGFSLATYMKQQHVMVTGRRKGPGPEDLELGQHGLRRRVRLRCRNYLAAFRVVGATDLILTMPERYASLLGSGLQIRSLRMPLSVPPLELCLYWHDRVHDDPANRWLRGLLQSVFDDRRSARNRLRSASGGP